MEWRRAETLIDGASGFVIGLGIEVRTQLLFRVRIRIVPPCLTNWLLMKCMLHHCAIRESNPHIPDVISDVPAFMLDKLSL